MGLVSLARNMSQNNKADPKLFLWDYFKFKFGNCSTKYYLVNYKQFWDEKTPSPFLRANLKRSRATRDRKNIH